MTPNTIEFHTTEPVANSWVMRITADRRIEVNENVDVTYAAQKVLDAMQYLLEPKREWVGLTDEERIHIWDVIGNSDAHGDVDGWSGRAVMDALEAKLKEKNCGQ